jgi:hypothetical protein
MKIPFLDSHNKVIGSVVTKRREMNKIYEEVLYKQDIGGDGE